MTPKTRNIILGSVSGVLLIGGAAAVIITSNKKKKEITDIMNKLNTGAGATGTIVDLNTDDAFNTNLLTSGRVPAGASLIKVATAQDYARQFNGFLDQYGGLYDDEEGAINLLRKIGTKAKLSQVSKEFLKIYSKDLGDFLTSKIDKGGNPAIFKQVITNMKLY